MFEPAAVDLGVRSVLAIVAGGLANFMLGGLWYMVLFNRRWVAASGMTPADFEGSSPGGGMALTLAGCVVTTGAFAVVYQWAGGQGIGDALAVGTVLGVGIAAMEGMKAAVYSTDPRAHPWALYAINGSYAVLGLVVGGVVYALIA